MGNQLVSLLRVTKPLLGHINMYKAQYFKHFLYNMRNFALLFESRMISSNSFYSGLSPLLAPQETATQTRMSAPINNNHQGG